MIAFVLGLFKSYITKELLVSLFKEVLVEFALEEIEKFAKDTENTYDDNLVKKFSDWAKS